MALGVYKFGLENVLPTEPRFPVHIFLVMILLFSTHLSQLLQWKHDWMTRKCKTCDPLQVLSLDLVEIVMKHLSFAKLT